MPWIKDYKGENAEHRKMRRSVRYKKWREGLIRGTTNCEFCDHFFFGPGERQLDHIVPVSVSPEGFWDDENTQVLCRSCHYEKSRREQKLLCSRPSKQGYLLGCKSDGTPIFGQTLVEACRLVNEKVKLERRK